MTEYFELCLETIINFYIKKCLKNNDWEIAGIDITRNKILLKRNKI